MEFQTFLFHSAFILSLLSLHIYHIERKLVKLSETIEESVDLQIQELKQILKAEVTSCEHKTKEAFIALNAFKEDIAVILESIRNAKETKYKDKTKDDINHNLKILKDVAQGKISTQSTQLGNFIPGNANDGNLNTFSQTKFGDNGHFWEVDLGREFMVKQIEIFVRNDCCGFALRGLDMSVGSSHKMMTQCAFYEGPAETGLHLVFECPRIIRGRFVKLEKEDLSSLALAEVKVMAFKEHKD